MLFRFSKEYLAIEEPQAQPGGSGIGPGWSVVPDLGHPYKVSELTHIYSMHIHEHHSNFY